MYRRKMSLRTVEGAWRGASRCAKPATRARGGPRVERLFDWRTAASGCAMQPHDTRLGVRHHAAHPLGGGHHRIPDTVSITVARRVAMRWRHHLRCTVLAVVVA